MTTKSLHIIIGTSVLIFLSIEPVLAGPGGKIANAAFETFWGRVILGMLTIFFLPIIVVVTVGEKLASRRALKDLAFVARYDQRFDWLNIRSRSKDCFHRVHLGWQNGDLSDVSHWMTSWYWQNQQNVFLNQWKAQGLTNICNIKKIKTIRPLLFVHKNYEGAAHEGSQLILGITAKMQDYLKNDSTDKVVEGSKKWKEVETLWTLTLTDGVWLVTDIEEDSLSYAYSKMRKNLPNIETTIIDQLYA